MSFATSLLIYTSFCFIFSFAPFLVWDFEFLISGVNFYSCNVLFKNVEFARDTVTVSFCLRVKEFSSAVCKSCFLLTVV